MTRNSALGRQCGDRIADVIADRQHSDCPSRDAPHVTGTEEATVKNAATAVVMRVSKRGGLQRKGADVPRSGVEDPQVMIRHPHQTRLRRRTFRHRPGRLGFVVGQITRRRPGLASEIRQPQPGLQSARILVEDPAVAVEGDDHLSPVLPRGHPAANPPRPSGTVSLGVPGSSTPLEGGIPATTDRTSAWMELLRPYPTTAAAKAGSEEERRRANVRRPAISNSAAEQRVTGTGRSGTCHES